MNLQQERNRWQLKEMMTWRLERTMTEMKKTGVRILTILTFYLLALGPVHYLEGERGWIRSIQGHENSMS